MGEARHETDGKGTWAQRVKRRRHVNVAAVAIAAKHARLAWVILAHGTEPLRHHPSRDIHMLP
jgi:transposase